MPAGSRASASQWRSAHTGLAHHLDPALAGRLERRGEPQQGLEDAVGGVHVMASAILTLLDRDRMMTHPTLRGKLEAVGFGVFIPVFFVTSGMELELGALFEGGGAVLLVPVLLVALLLFRGLPALLYRSRLGSRGAVAADLLQATSLPFIVAATEIGVEIVEQDPATGAALVVAGLLSVVLFELRDPFASLSPQLLLRFADGRSKDDAASD